LLFSAMDTVATETPARLAMSESLGAFVKTEEGRLPKPFSHQALALVDNPAGQRSIQNSNDCGGTVISRLAPARLPREAFRLVTV
jgi:hypothetical protein